MYSYGTLQGLARGGRALSSLDPRIHEDYAFVCVC